jgi:uncharacterized delta-60 repeat protein
MTALLSGACTADVRLGDILGDSGVVDDGGGAGLAAQSGGSHDSDDAPARDGGDTTDAGKTGPPSGVLDPSFAGTGYVVRSGTAGSGGLSPVDIGYGITADSLGRVLVGGGASNGASNQSAVIWRLDAAGAFDSTFGSGGAWIAPVEGGETAALGVAVDSADRPLVTGLGWVPAGSGSEAMPIWRLTTDGVPDTSFNGTGQAFANTLGSPSLGSAVACDPAGAPVVAGWGHIGNASEQTMAWRLTSAGGSDTSLGSPYGFVLATHLTGSFGDRGQAVALDSSGNVVIGGFTHYQAGDSAAVIWRFDRIGNPDTSFGGAGFVAFQYLGGQAVSSIDAVHGVAVDARGGILFSGTTMGTNANYRGFVGRLTSEGALDSSFGQGGIVVFEPRATGVGTSGRGMTIDSQGRILVAGAADWLVDGGLAEAAAVWRLTSTGAPDTSFGDAGISLAPVPGSRTTYAYAVAVDPTDRAVVAGFSSPPANPSHVQLLVFRLTP